MNVQVIPPPLKRSGKIPNGVVSARFKDLSGKEFGRWMVIRPIGFVDGCTSIFFLCQCTCGEFGSIKSSQLTGGGSTSCGCLTKEVNRARETTHGMYKTPEFKTWQGIRQRCNNPKCPMFEDYGGRGIHVCYGWDSEFKNFFSSVGLRPEPKLTIDRENNEGHYSCGRCWECTEMGWSENWRWATKKQQQNNRRNTLRIKWDGREMCALDWELEIGISANVLWKRIKGHGWSVEKAMTKPVRRKLS
jgi:hypothetical protein